jgi:hypothetical protein
MRIGRERTPSLDVLSLRGSLSFLDAKHVKKKELNNPHSILYYRYIVYLPNMILDTELRGTRSGTRVITSNTSSADSIPQKPSTTKDQTKNGVEDAHPI